MSDENEPRETVEELAVRYLEVCVRLWAARGLPSHPLASAFTAWGLNSASAEASPGEVADGLERIAETVRELDDALPPALKH